MQMDLIFVAALLAAAGVFTPASAQGDWRWGRATHYGERGYYSIHRGSCGFGNLDYHKGTGYNIGALSDVHYEHWNGEGACGKCYEVKCEPMTFKDNYGNKLDRSGACYDPDKTVTIMITDTCPCKYASNSYSNRRWCCGDMDHIDLSYHTYDQLAARNWGVIGLKYRPVPCPGQPTQGTYYEPSQQQQQQQQQQTSQDSAGLDWFRKLIVGDDQVESFAGPPSGK